MEPYQQLEEEFGQWTGNRNTVVCSSGTAALHLALESLDLPRGSAVAVPDFTMVACARAVTLAGLIPWFVDCGDDLLINPDLLEAAPPHVQAVMPVHIYGRQCNMSRIVEIANQRGWHVIEDLAEAHGVSPHPSTNAACWSFYQNKIICGEEGGAIAFASAASAVQARKLRSLGFTANHDFSHIPRGHNYRLANLLAVPIIGSLHDYEDNAARRRWVETQYNELVPKQWQMPKRDAVWVYDLRIHGMTQAQQDSIVTQLNQQGIAARHAFKPMTSQPEYLSTGRSEIAPVMSCEVIYLPVRPSMSLGDAVFYVRKLLKTAASVGVRAETT
jgi:dTDP-4-amino-4,6-dideoxygalactose transaminase